MKKWNRAAAYLLCVVTTATGIPAIGTPMTVKAEEVSTQADTGSSASGVIFADSRTDFRDESIYFVMTTRFYDGDESNNVQCWDGTQYDDENDPEWRGDFKGLAEKLDYIKALGFTAIWITPVVENTSGYDYHGYHASNFSKVDSRYESEDFTYQDFIDAAHAKGMKVIQDVVFNHTCNFGESNLFPIFEKVGDISTSDCLQPVEGGGLPENYDSLTPQQQYQARLALMKNTDGVNHDTENIYHHEGNMSWESYTCQTGQIADDCVDLNTENPKVYNYLQDAYNQYIDMGVDAFRVDTTKHVSRLTFNNALINPFYEEAAANGNDDFYMFGEVCTRVREVWNKGVAPLSAPFYTWKESKNYAWSETDTTINEASAAANYNDNLSVDTQPTSNNAVLSGNDYHTPDYTQRSGLGVIDFPMHWNFGNANDAFNVAVSGDKWYNDATWNVTYVDSHDYAPDQAPENQRFAGSQDTWAENLSLMFTFRGIPCIYYGSEIEFQKGKVIDVGPNAPLSETGRAYYGDNLGGGVTATDFGQYFAAEGTTEDTLNYPLAKHIQRLNKIRQAVPALRKGQYSTADISGNNMAYKRRYTDSSTDSFALITVSGSATFNNIPNGTYVDCITGDTKNVSNGSLTADCSGKGNLRVYVLNTDKTQAPGKVGVDGKYLYTSSPSDSSVEQQGVFFENEAGWNNVTANLYNSNGSLKASIPMSVAKGNVYAASYDGDLSGCQVSFTNGSASTVKTGVQNAGLYNADGYVKQYSYDEDKIPVESVTLDQSNVELNIGGTATVNATVLPENATNKNLSWTSSDKTVATVSKGVITAQEEGTAVITAKSNNGIEAKVTVTVKTIPYDYEEVDEGYTAVYFKKPQSWGTAVNCYAYYDSDTLVTNAWPGTSMERLPNGVYRYVYETPENESVKVLFNDGSNQAPASVGFDATAYGLYGQSGLEEIIVPVTKKLSVSLSADKASPQTIGTAINLTADAKKGEGEIQYCFSYVKDGKTQVIRDYSTENTATFTPEAAGTYTIRADVKDEAGKTAVSEMQYTWEEAESSLVVKSITASKTSPQLKGTSIKLTATAKGGEGDLEYRFSRTKDGVTKVFRDYTSANTAYCNPGDAGEYTITVDVRDAKGTQKSAEIKYVWEAENTELKINDFKANKVSPQPKGTTIKLQADAEGGSGELQYRFSREKDGVVTVFRDYATSNRAYCNPSAGNYKIYVDVKDAKGNVVTKSMDYEWTAPSEELKITGVEISKTSPQPAGTTVKIKVHTEGGSGDLQYRFYRVKDSYVKVFRDFGSGNTAYCNPGKGNYKIYVDVKDAQGNIETEMVTFEWQ